MSTRAVETVATCNFKGVMILFPGRYTARPEKPLILFLIGMRINRLRAVKKWWPVAQAMPTMLRELSQRPDSGLLWCRSYISGHVLLVQQYWESFDKLLAYAHDKQSSHFPAWAEYNKRVGLAEGSVGVWHKSYVVEAGKSECIYTNMPRFGLAVATTHVKAEGRLASAKDRMAP